MNKWERWYAWHPIRTLGGHWVWLKDVERKAEVRRLLGVDLHSSFDTVRFFYRLPIIILREVYGEFVPMLDDIRQHLMNNDFNEALAAVEELHMRMLT